MTPEIHTCASPSRLHDCLLHCVTFVVAGYHEARSAVARYSSSLTVTVDPEVDNGIYTVLEGC